MFRGTFTCEIMSYYDDDEDYMIYEDGGNDGSDNGDSGEYSYPEDENDLDFVRREDDDDGEDDEDEFADYGSEQDRGATGGTSEFGSLGDNDNEIEADISNNESFQRGSGRNRANRISFLQDFVSRLAEGREGTDDVEGDRSHGGGRGFNGSLPELLHELSRSEDFFGGNRGNSRYMKLIENVMQAENDPYVAMESLRELSEQLLMINPLIAERMFPSGKLLDAIVNVLSSTLLEQELELQLIACRCLYNFFEMNPEIIGTAVENDIVFVLKRKLAEISYIDLAEQVLETLEFISRVHGVDILRNGALPSCLQYLDFFTIHAQRKAISIVANSCARCEDSDYDMINEIFPTLKSVFSNNSDAVILKRILVTFYSVCGSIESKCLPALFDLQIVKKLLVSISSADFEMESILKILDMLSLLVSADVELSKQMLLECDITSLMNDVFQPYRKSKESSLSEILIYVPKPLLLALTIFISLLLPTEDDQILTADHPRLFKFDEGTDAYSRLTNELMPYLVEIYSNSVDIRVRYTVLVALTRIYSSMSKIGMSTPLDPSILNLLSTGLTSYTRISAEELKSDNGSILLAILSLMSVLLSKKPEENLRRFKKEGVFQCLTVLSQKVASIYSEDDVEHETSFDAPVFGERRDESEEEENFEMEYDDMSIPEFVKPRKIKIDIYSHLTPYYILKNMFLFINTLLELLLCDDDNIASELSYIGEIVSKIKEFNFENKSCEYWFDVWSDVKESLFKQHVALSGFELINTGLIDTISYVLESLPSRQSACRRMFIKAFDDKLEEFVGHLQSALTRSESFSIVDTGLSGNISQGSSLVKQIKIRLLYDENSSDDLGNLSERKDIIPDNLKDVVVSIHCVASLKTLDDFLRHKILQSEFLHSIIPNFESPSLGIGPAEVTKELEGTEFEFSIGNHQVDRSATIYAVIFRQALREGKPSDTIWSEVPVLKYKRVAKTSEHPRISLIYPNHGFDGKDLKPIKSILTLLDTARLGNVTASSLVNPRISAKLSRQMEESLIVACGVLPAWVLDITKNYWFLFPFETRMNFLRNTSYGYGRLIQFWRDKVANDKISLIENSLQQLGRLTRHKLRVTRDSLFLSGIKILEKYGSSPDILEIEYKDEEGTGLGPTLEFYTLMSGEFVKKSLDMWRVETASSGEKSSEYVSNSLFPRPMTSSSNEKLLKLFENLGTFVARSMLDNRILDFRFSPIFFELLHKRSKGERLDFENLDYPIELVHSIDPQLGKSLLYLYEHRMDKSIEELHLNFTLPGDEVELLTGGAEIFVTSQNVEEYLIRTMEYLLDKGINRQLDAFIRGFSKSFPYSSLLVLSPEELADLCGGIEEDWSVQTLYSCISADHGYSMDSPAIHDLISILSEFSKQERRIFLQFITGSPKLPIGGFKNLKPKFTVVLKHPEEGMQADQYLPSVMTCANYLKLPKYSHKSIMHQRLLHAMTEGAGAFLLS